MGKRFCPPLRRSCASNLVLIDLELRERLALKAQFIVNPMCPLDVDVPTLATQGRTDEARFTEEQIIGWCGSMRPEPRRVIWRVGTAYGKRRFTTAGDRTRRRYPRRLRVVAPAACAE